MAALALYDWPGNVRELENVAGQIVMHSRGQTAASLPPSVDTLLSGGQHRSPPPVARPSTTAQSQITDEDVANALAAGNGSASRAAKILGVSRTTYYELRKRNPNLRSIGRFLIPRFFYAGTSAPVTFSRWPSVFTFL